jgi:hypothetical protein
MTTQQHSQPLKEPQYPVPKSLAEACERKRLLEHNIQILSVQLRSGDRLDAAGKRLPPTEYKSWAARAHMKRAHMLSEHAQVREYILRFKRELRTPGELRDIRDPYQFVVSIRQALALHERDRHKMTIKNIMAGIDRFLHDHKPTRTSTR